MPLPKYDPDDFRRKVEDQFKPNRKAKGDVPVTPSESDPESSKPVYDTEKPVDPNDYRNYGAAGAQSSRLMGLVGPHPDPSPSPTQTAIERRKTYKATDGE